jgi:hypothetical protein
VNKIICNSIEEFKQKFKEVPPCPEYFTRVIFPVSDPEEALIGVAIIDGIEGIDSNLPLIQHCYICMKIMLAIEEDNLKQIYKEFGKKLDEWVKDITTKI